LLLFEREDLILLFEKHGLQTEPLQYEHLATKPMAVRDAIVAAAPSSLNELVQEIARTKSTMRSNITPRYTFDERWQEFRRCLQLDGYAVARNEYGHELNEFAPIEPIIEGADRPEDDLTVQLRRSGLAGVDGILRLLEASAASFRNGDSNGCLTNARVALQTLATAIAIARPSGHPGSFDRTKWGQVASYLRTSGFITPQQEQCLAAVFSFLSPGAHIPLGFTEEEFTRLGRGLAVSFCYFLAKTLNAS
jgi:hypothetical protein